MSSRSTSSDTEPFEGFTIKDFRDCEKAAKATVCSGEIITKKQPNTNNRNSSTSSDCASHDQWVDEQDISGTENINDSEEGSTSNSEIEGVLADNIFGCSYQTDKVRKSNADDTDNDQTIIETHCFNRYSSSEGNSSFDKYFKLSSEESTEQQSEPPKKRGKFKFGYGMM